MAKPCFTSTSGSLESGANEDFIFRKSLVMSCLAKPWRYKRKALTLPRLRTGLHIEAGVDSEGFQERLIVQTLQDQLVISYHLAK